MTKKILSREEHYLQFDDEELEALGIKKGQKFTVEADGESWRLIPFKSLEIDLSEFSRETLEFWIKESCEKDISCNEIAIEAIKAKVNEV